LENKSGKENNKFIENFNRKALVEKGQFKDRGRCEVCGTVPI
jgi:hypothetical protein